MPLNNNQPAKDRLPRNCSAGRSGYHTSVCPNGAVAISRPCQDGRCEGLERVLHGQGSIIVGKP